ncbi:acyl-CoA thioesterase [Streptomyces sp. NPDC051582]|uniref:acyl-CoA thioesterase n=1 Tax=Streptomyces sp. NPDC051582 TaxID=3155167 RepID=UPI0034281258
MREWARASAAVPAQPPRRPSGAPAQAPTEAPAEAPAGTDHGCAAGCPESLVPRLPCVVIERRVEWPDTDAAGHYHHSTVVRWVEAAEAVLLRRLGLAHLFGSTPRVHFEADYRARLWFGEAVRIELSVAKVGSSSLTYVFTVTGEENVEAATGRMVIAHSAARAAGTTPWPADVREVLTKSGPQAPELRTLAAKDVEHC